MNSFTWHIVIFFCDLLHTLLSCLLNQVWCVAYLFLLESTSKSVYVFAYLAWH